MKKFIKKISILLLAVILISSFAACQNQDETSTDESSDAEAVDYVTELKLDKSSGTKQLEVTVKTFVDGDTTHFNAPSSDFSGGMLKARYIAINTPESTGKIEEWGKKASNFTKEKLSGAESIIVESDTASWNVDSTGGRYLVWVWYKPEGESEYRNLNLEILQNGLCIASSTANNRYGEICMKALEQAKSQKLNVHSGEKDPDFYYGGAVELSLVELRSNIEEYTNTKVAFEGVVTLNDGQSVYIEEFDPDTGMYYGITAYYGYSLSGDGLQIISVGNRVRMVGSVQYYEAGGTYQISDLTYRAMKPDDPMNIQFISADNKPAYVETDVDTFLNSKVEIDIEEKGKLEFDYAYLAMSTSVSMKNLTVTDVYTTNNEASSSNGAMTLTCVCDGQTISVRTDVFRDENGELITADKYLGKTIDVKGVVDYYNGYQIKVLNQKDITIKG